MSQIARLAEQSIFTQPPKTIGGHREPFNTLSLVHAYISVVTTCTAFVVVGYVLIWLTVYFGCLLAFRNCWNTGCPPLDPLLKKTQSAVSA